MATDTLFSTPLTINGTTKTYHVFFENETYRFLQEDNAEAVLELRREEDEWHTESTIEESTKSTAINALDEYLLSQH